MCCSLDFTNFIFLESCSPFWNIDLINLYIAADAYTNNSKSLANKDHHFLNYLPIHVFYNIDYLFSVRVGGVGERDKQKQKTLKMIERWYLNA